MFCQVKSKQELEPFFDFILESVNKMIKKTGEEGTNSETFITTMLKIIDSGNAFILLHADSEKKKLDGFIYASYLTTARTVEFMGMWSAPGVAKKVRFEGQKIFEEWARAKGAQRIIAGLTRSPEKFFKFFHEPLGFRKIGIIIQKDLVEIEKEAENAG
jgi:hypothetical protein